MTQQRTWFITGVNSGFGRLMTEQLLARGDRVAGTVRKLETMADLKQQYGDRLWLAQLDMTQTQQIQKVVGAAFDELGKIDAIVSNAGYGLFGAAEELSDEQVVHQLATNLLGPIMLVRAALPHLRAQGGGRIIGLSTFGGQATLPGGSLYHASKWGLEGFLESIGQELAAFQIGVTIIEPGSARTNFRHGGAQLGQPLDAYQGTPAAMVHAMLKDTSRLPLGDPTKMSSIIIDSVEQTPAPRRIVLGSDSWGIIRKALTERLAAVEAQQELAASTDIVPGA
ncbi:MULTISPECIES: SDR family oxidoreductase [unclassified Janthinobacterium]|uniref:SDR family oxidoreductase n=1 Tax=unclassified Janthinobacterium TaxID=2610881 RepID=UPI00160D7C38|nr:MULTISPECIES: SDR family oxidoreductase [unclassified Janthinobacterium]MBB5610076.1 NAD(P)-dependent dehydrogenase (short-subunit alcohol dehydrogenase family) [Janthinobacterium sp. S3T4]MBB5615290.1 NAD(P)-dependent dehydrogenase (short-subunit alcohol dehydrogenase family) [Janthinobacterium sp. S3M3]